MSAHMVPIGEVVDFIGGGTPSRDVDNYWNGDIPWASVKDFKGPSIDSTLESITHDGLSASSSALIPAGHVIMPTRMALGKAAINSIDVAINQDLKALKPKTMIDTRYLLHAILSRAKEIQSHGKGATVQGITIERLRAIQIPLPPLEEQRRTAAILDKAQDLSLRTRLSNQLASSLIESEMIQRFDRPGRLQSQSTLLTLVDAGVTVIDCPHSTPQWTEDGKICLRTSNLGKGDWIWQDTRHISDDDFLERSRRAPVEPGDIILSREGTVGIAAIVTSDMEVCMGQRLVQLKLDTRRLMPEYLLAQLLYLLKPQRISHAMTGSTSKHINVKDLRELKVHCPPIQEQLDFENFCDSAKKLRSRICILGQKSDVLSRSIQMASFKS
jgi:type I restriction enzyme S subunit